MRPEMDQRITISIEAGIADVRLARPEKLNAIDDAMFDALIATGEQLKHERGLRAVVLSGEGRAFCAGLDMGNFDKMASGAGETSVEMQAAAGTSGPNRAQKSAIVWRAVPVPVIAAVHGVAFGGGFQIMLGADIRFVAGDTKLAAMEMRWGLIPDMAGVTRLRRLVRDDILRDLIYTGRIFSGEKAAQIGVATRACPDPRAEALALAAEIAAKSPHAIRAAKRLANLAEDADEAALIAAEAAEQLELIGSLNQVEAVRANLEKREAKFQDVQP